MKRRSRTCERKARFDRVAAEKRAEEITRESGRRMRPYQCRECSAYHLSSWSEAQQEALGR